jgi:hypothetical protein
MPGMLEVRNTPSLEVNPSRVIVVSTHGMPASAQSSRTTALVTPGNAPLFRGAVQTVSEVTQKRLALVADTA